jgi:hypothetical protein
MSSKHSEETKRLMSEKRIKWLKDNPDKHPWRNKDKCKSEPCERFKDFLKSKDISFIEEYQPEIDSRFFSVDIAIPDKMIAIEINGNQHYERNGLLKPYYQERHELLENHGWDVYEIHYSACFNLDKLDEFVSKMKTSSKKIEFDYFNYVPKSNKCADKSCECGKSIRYYSNKCKSCNDTHNTINRRNSNAPSKEELEKLIWEYPLTKLGKMFGVSDNGFRKWCKKEGITNFPPRGYFIKNVRETGIEPALIHYGAME